VAEALARPCLAGLCWAVCCAAPAQSAQSTGTCWRHRSWAGKPRNLQGSQRLRCYVQRLERCVTHTCCCARTDILLSRCARPDQPASACMSSIPDSLQPSRSNDSALSVLLTCVCCAVRYTHVSLHRACLAVTAHQVWCVRLNHKFVRRYAEQQRSKLSTTPLRPVIIHLQSHIAHTNVSARESAQSSTAGEGACSATSSAPPRSGLSSFTCTALRGTQSTSILMLVDRQAQRQCQGRAFHY
jgi:hypothetical protein